MLGKQNIGGRYELSNHLGNVLGTISDYKSVVNSGTGLHYEAVVLTAQDYDPFGMAMPHRTFNGEGYSRGFNGQERDFDINADGNINTAMFWEYDARLGRRWNVDPVLKHYESPFATFGNNPISFIDPNGDDSSGTFTQARANPNNPKADFSDLDKKSYVCSGEEPSSTLKYFNIPVGKREQVTLEKFKKAFFSGTQFINSTDDDKIINHFISGDGTSLHFDTNSDISSIISDIDAFKDFANAFEKDALNYFNLKGDIEKFNANKSVLENKPDYINGYGPKGLFAWATMGGYKKITATITTISANEISVVYKIEDHFGAGKMDSGSWVPGLSEMYLLQKYEGKSLDPNDSNTYNPFKWDVTINRISKKQ